jgi:acyl carrier protein
MTDAAIDSSLRKIFSTILDVPLEAVDDGLTPPSCPQWDSLNHIHLVNAIEEEFDITLDFEQQMRILSLGAAVGIVRAALKSS